MSEPTTPTGKRHADGGTPDFIEFILAIETEACQQELERLLARFDTYVWGSGVDMDDDIVKVRRYLADPEGAT